jgi:very-short-patch-repair endonuclease
MSIGNNVSMFYNAKPHIFEKAKILRKHMTSSEQRLWECLKGKQILELRFRPQHPLDTYIADFYCHPIKLVIEVDGGYHKTNDQIEYDIEREAVLIEMGIKVVRYTNDEVDRDIDNVINQIKAICLERKEMIEIPL